MITGRLRMGTHERVEPGNSAQLRVELIAGVYVEPGMTFLIRDGNQGPVSPRGTPARWAGTAGMGRVLTVAPT